MIADHKGEIPVVFLLLPFITGICIGMYCFPSARSGFLHILFSIISLLFILLNINYGRFELYKHRWIGGLLINLTLFLFGWLSAVKHQELNHSDHFSKLPAQYLVVKINNGPKLKNGMLRFTAAVEETINSGKKSAVSGTLLITIKDSIAKKLDYGDELLIPAKYNAIDPPLTPAAFNYKNYLANQNIFYQAFILPKQYALLNSDTGNPIISYSLKLRQRLVEKLKYNIHDTAAMAVASSLILGYKADMSEDILQAYSKTGTVYVLSVSGAQVGILYVLLTLSFTFLNRYKSGKIIKAIIIIAIIWYYALLTGFSLSVCRAALVISLVLIGKTFNRYINSLNLLAIAAFILLIYNPFFVADVGFQLSFSAVAGLIIFRPTVYKWFVFKNNFLDNLWGICSVCIAAQVSAFPLAAFYFHQFPVYFLLSNLFVIIPSAVIMYAGVFFLLLPQMPVLSSSLVFILKKTIIIMNQGLANIENYPFASIDKIWMTVPECLLLYIIIICVFYFFYDKKIRLLQLALFCTLALCIIISIKRVSQSRLNTIVFLNLNKHQGIIFKKGNEAFVLTDIHPYDKIYKYSIQPYLDSCQVDNVTIADFDRDINLPWLKKKYNLVQFFNKRVIIFDGKGRHIFFSQKLKSDYIYLSLNPYFILKQINNTLGGKTLILDGSNNDYFIKVVQNVAVKQRIACKILKRNNSFISVSN